MGEFARDEPTLAACQRYRALLAVAEAIIAHRDLHALFHDLAGRLHQVVPFDYLILVLHDAAHNAMRLHVLETSEPRSPGSFSKPLYRVVDRSGQLVGAEPRGPIGVTSCSATG
jgi:hypothetical protein